MVEPMLLLLLIHSDSAEVVSAVKRWPLIESFPPEFHTFHRHCTVDLHSNEELHILTGLLMLLFFHLSCWLLRRKMVAGQRPL